MAETLDEARAVRAGETLDSVRLRDYLARHLDEVRADVELVVRQFPSGHSNLTYLLGAGEREYVLRRPPFGSKVKSAHDMGREFRILSALQGIFPLAPEPLVYCEDAEVLGAPFYVMRRVRGIILRKDFPAGLVMTPEQVTRLHHRFVDTLAALHGLDYAAAGLADLGRPEGYVQRQVKGWTERYAGSQTDSIPSVESVARWLAAEVPADTGAALVHNDYKLDNVVLDPADPTRIIGVLDWEMATIGDPLMDLGTMLSYWVQAGDHQTMDALRSGPTTAPGALTRSELAAAYAAATGRDVSRALYYHVFGLFKTAVVVQQIYFRYKQGLTRDERFASFIFGVQILADEAQRAIDRGRL